jgi:hypothetical protein
MAKKEICTCDLCEQPGTFTLTIKDNNLGKDVNTTDLCYGHFNRIRSFIRKGCPKVESIE